MPAWLRAVLVSIVVTGFGWGAVSVGLPALAVDLGSPQPSGVLFALIGLGSIVGGLSYGARAWRRPIGERYPILLLLLAVATVPLILAPSLPVAIALGGLAGLPWAPVFSSQYTLVGAVTLPGTVTEAFAWNTSAWAGGVAAGSALAGAIVERERRRRVDRGRVHLLRADGHGRRRQAGASRCSVGKLDLEHAFRLVGVPPERVNVW